VERLDAIAKLRTLVGTDLRPLADIHQITVWKGDKKNKGWAGHTIERFLGLPLNSAQSPNFGSWELKQVQLVAKRDGMLRVKETMAITRIDPVNVAAKPFEESHLLAKLRKIVVVARVFDCQEETCSFLHSVAEFDLGDTELYQQVKADYDLVRRTIITKGFSALTGRMGILVQPRTKGSGHGSVSRAFYARTSFVAQILGDGYHIPLPLSGEYETSE
jgi:DNA mismatch repair protein MutH